MGLTIHTNFTLTVAITHKIQTPAAQKQYNPWSSNTITTKVIYSSRFHTCNSRNPQDSNNQHKSNPSQDLKRSKTNTQHKLKKKTLATGKMTGWLQAIWSDESKTSSMNEAWVMIDAGEMSGKGWRWWAKLADGRRVRPRDDRAWGLCPQRRHHERLRPEKIVMLPLTVRDGCQFRDLSIGVVPCYELAIRNKNWF